jgi:uncharacterized membrane protein HdeD (DUF308 family)
VTDAQHTPEEPARDDAERMIREAVDPIGTVTRAIWWLVLIRGICAVVFGLIALLAPVTAFFAIVFVFAAYALIEGVIEIVHALRVRDRDRRWGWLMALGIIAVLAGIASFVFPVIAGFYYGTFVLALIAFYAVLMGIAGFPAAASLTDGGRKVLGYIVAGLTVAAGIALAIIVLVDPVAAIFNFIWVVGVWAIIIGAMLIVAAISARVSGRAVRPGIAAAPGRG